MFKSLAKIFGSNSKSNSIELLSPVNGKIINTNEIPDPTFADGILGPTIGIDPIEGVVYAPCDCKIEQIFKTGHAVSISTKDKLEILIHVGINTVDLKGEGFTALVKDDDEVTKGTPLIKFDINLIKEKGFSTIIPVVICNASDFGDISLTDPCNIDKLEKLATIELKQ